MYVFDATPLIYLAKADALVTICEPLDECIIPAPVFDEVVTTGVEHNHPDARKIQRAYEEDRFTVTEITDERTAKRLRANTSLSEADVAVLTIARETGGIAVMDERYGREVAVAENIETRGTAYLVLHATDERVITPETARAIIDRMIDAGWYISPSLYTKLIKRIETL